MFIDQVLAHYKNYHPHARPGKKERALVKARFGDGYSVDDLLAAIDGNHRSPYHCGENESGRQYHRLELIFRDASHVADFIEHAKSNGAPVLSVKTSRSLRAAKSWAQRTQKVEENDD